VDRAGRVGVALAFAALLLAIVTIWAKPRIAGDTFVALAGGRDVVEGKLGKSDDWSFTSQGRVWLNQNWGVDTVIYAAYRLGEESGLLILKAFFVVAIAAAAIVAARVRGASWMAGALVTAAILAGASAQFQLRANLATFLCAPVLLLILYRATAYPWTLWLACPLVAVWANLHGGFALSFPLIALWAVSRAAVALRGENMPAAARSLIAPGAVLTVCLVLAATLSPFGLENLTHPLTIARESEWRSVLEWRPISLASAESLREAWPLLAQATFIVLTALGRLLTTRAGRSLAAGPARGLAAPAAFDGALFCLLVAMAVSANRFLPLAAIALIPLTAVQADPLLRSERSRLPAVVAPLLLLIPLVGLASRVAARYSPRNPRFTTETFFQRMTDSDRMPVGAVEFLADNNVTGRVFNDWRWEGFLRWWRPQLQLFLGGRAQQIYGVEALQSYRQIKASRQPAEALANWKTGLVVVPFEDETAGFLTRLVFAPGAQWRVSYNDGRTLVLADPGNREARSLVEAVSSGTARFRSRSVAALSRASCAASIPSAAAPGEALQSLAAAARDHPALASYWLLYLSAARQNAFPPWLLRFLEEERGRLAAQDLTRPGGFAVLEGRRAIAMVLGRINLAAGRIGEAYRAAEEAQLLQDELHDVLGRS
jgi:hypothetical protein